MGCDSIELHLGQSHPLPLPALPLVEQEESIRDAPKISNPKNNALYLKLLIMVIF
jgi:hypothetical protein